MVRYSTLDYGEASSEDEYGDVWDSTTAQEAFDGGTLRSSEDESELVRVVFRNHTSKTLVLSWIDENGKADEPDEVEPVNGSGDDDDDDSDNEEETKEIDRPLDDDDDVEATYLGHTWCLGLDSIEEVEDTKVFKQSIGAYRPTDHSESSPDQLHVVTITEEDDEYRVVVKLAFFEEIAETWNSKEAAKAFNKKRIRSENTDEDSDSDEDGSKDDDDEILEYRVIFRNCTSRKDLAVIFLDQKGTPEDYYYEKEVVNGVNVDSPICEDDEIIDSFIGHAFIWAVCENVERCERHDEVDRVIGAYKGVIRGDEDAIHVVTLTETEDDKYEVSAKLCYPDPTPVDTTDKTYSDEIIGGWPCKVEENWEDGDKKLKKLLQNEFAAAVSFLPPHARAGLIENTPFYINR